MYNFSVPDAGPTTTPEVTLLELVHVTHSTTWPELQMAPLCLQVYQVCNTPINNTYICTHQNSTKLT